MRRKLCVLLLCTAIVLTAGSAGASAAEGSLIFISINDLLPPELINCVAVYDGLTYVPYSVFTDYGLGISYTWFSNAATACLSIDQERKLYFEITTGNTYDEANTEYSAPAILRSGTVYLPLDFVCGFFGGLSYTLISGSAYGSVLRICSSAVILNDTSFLLVAEDAMKSYGRKYLAENGLQETQPPAQQPPAPTPPPESHEGELVYLSFVGIPEDRVMAELAEFGVSACFFLTGDEIAREPGRVRRMIGAGHSIGIYCDSAPASAWREGSALLYEAARYATVLTASAEAQEEAWEAVAEEMDLVCCFPALSTVLTDARRVTAPELLEQLDAYPDSVSVRLDGRGEQADTAILVLQYLNEQRYEVVCPGETD